MTAKEMFKALGYEQVTNNDDLIEYTDYSHEDGGYKYIIFNRIGKEYGFGYFDIYVYLIKKTMRVSIKEHEAITKQMKELGWI